MPTTRDPIQLDEMPEKYDRASAQRVLESAVRRLTDERVEAPAQSAAAAAPNRTDDPLPWVL